MLRGREDPELGVWYLPVLWPPHQTNLQLFVQAKGHGALAMEHGGGQPHVALGWSRSATDWMWELTPQPSCITSTAGYLPGASGLAR